MFLRTRKNERLETRLKPRRKAAMAGDCPLAPKTCAVLRKKHGLACSGNELTAKTQEKVIPTVLAGIPDSSRAAYSFSRTAGK